MKMSGKAVNWNVRYDFDFLQREIFNIEILSVKHDMRS